ncbi:MAG: family 16 glycosylhydrolase [Clostridia bacterium]|nr:family 16 glycosylhydrolase [Clostridia bacterium]
MEHTNAKLAITELIWNAENQPKPGTPLTFTVTLTNVGDVEFSAECKKISLTVQVNREQLSVIEFDGNLAAGESVTIDSSVWEAVHGNHVVCATLDFAQPCWDNFGTGVIFVKNLRVSDKTLPVPPLAAKVGMNTLTFSDDFTTLDTIDTAATGKLGYKWYPTRPYGATTLKPTDYEITENGLLLKEEENYWNYGLNMMDVVTAAGWGFTHGYMEARFRMPSLRAVEGTKGVPAIWSFPPEKLFSKCRDWVEMDWMEYWGDMYGEDLLYTVTMHHQQFVDPSTPQYVYWANNRSTSHHYGLSDGKWHVMGWLWKKGSLTTYVDGKEIMTQHWSKDDVPTPDAKLNQGDWLKGTFSPIDHQLMPVIINGAFGWPLELDYLNIWQAD